MGDIDPVSFDTHLYYWGAELQVSAGTAGSSSYHVVVALGKDAADEAPKGTTTYETSNMRIQVTSDYADYPDQRPQFKTHLISQGLGALTPRRVDAVAVLKTMSADPAAAVDRSGFTALADLQTVLRILLGIEIRRPDGQRGIPRGSTVPVDVIPGEEWIRRLHLEGEAVARALKDVGIDPTDPVGAGLQLFDVTIDYEEPGR
jgi:hypothetical protein